MTTQLAIAKNVALNFQRSKKVVWIQMQFKSQSEFQFWRAESYHFLSEFYFS